MLITSPVVLMSFLTTELRGPHQFVWFVRSRSRWWRRQRQWRRRWRLQRRRLWDEIKRTSRLRYSAAATWRNDRTIAAWRLGERWRRCRVAPCSGQLRLRSPGKSPRTSVEQISQVEEERKEVVVIDVSWWLMAVKRRQWESRQKTQREGHDHHYGETHCQFRKHRIFRFTTSSITTKFCIVKSLRRQFNNTWNVWY